MRRFITLLCLIVLPAANAAAAGSPPAYDKSPLYFEINRPNSEFPGNNDLMVNGRIDLPPFGPVDIRGFDWKVHTRRDKSWWLAVERFEYFLPLIESGDKEHERMAKGWFTSWYDAHMDRASPNEGAWQGMIAGIRVMVFIRYLKLLQQDPHRDEAIITKLRATILDHQEYLADPINFESRSNHGMWNAIGLFETTRVLPDPKLTQTALDRLMLMAKISISNKGIHREHSPGYHFFFLEWLANDVKYLKSIPGWSTPEVVQLAERRDAMVGAAWFLCDHGGDVARIGDSGGKVDDALLERIEPGKHDLWVYDPQAGYAIFKDPVTTAQRRYIAFNIQNFDNQPRQVYHFHNDVGAVYYSDDGEVVLGDQGRYSYSSSVVRDYFESCAAHNAIFPERFLYDRVTPQLGHSQSVNAGDGRVSFGIGMYGAQAKRTVEIPYGSESFVVRDMLLGDQPFVALWNIGPDVVSLDRQHDPPAKPGRQAYQWLLTTAKGRRFSLTVTISGDGLELRDILEVVSGSRDPWLGWYAPGYETLEASKVLRFNLLPTAMLKMITTVERVSSP